MDREYRSFDEFWPHYVREHSLRTTRRFHFVGLVLALCALLAAVLVDWRHVFLAPVFGYGCAWYSHFFIEHNRPATFTYPLWSLAGDVKMFWLMLQGQMDAEVSRHIRLPDRGRAQG